MKTSFKTLLLLVTFTIVLISCGEMTNTEQKSASGVNRATVEVKLNANGYTAEQQSIIANLEETNRVGVIGHLYVIAPNSGDVILYSTVQGKPTSSGKRLTPTTVNKEQYSTAGTGYGNGVPIIISGTQYYTNELIQDDGTYGSSESYIYWKDVRGTYHRHYMLAGQIVHYSSVPMNFPKIILNIEQLAGTIKVNSTDSTKTK